MSAELVFSDATELARAIRARELSPVELVRAFLEREDQWNALVTPAPDAERRAGEADAALRRGDEVGPLHGVPFTVKDTFDTAGLRTTRGSRLFADHVPLRGAGAVERLKEAGGILLGKTNTPEFALWWETDNLVFGRTDNPWEPSRTAGGSSGGEAAALAGGLTPLGLGSDLGGSIRLPAAWCGVVGLKPTHGLVSLDGHWPRTLLEWMHAGPMARSVSDAALALSVLAPATPAPPERNPRVGMTLDAFGPLDEEVDAAVRGAGEVLDAEEVESPELAAQDWNALTLMLYGAGSARYFAETVGGRADDLHPMLRDRLRSGGAPAPEDLTAARVEVSRLLGSLAKVFGRFDLLLCASVPEAAPEHGVSSRDVMRATIPFNVSGSPALTVPFGLTRSGLPLGVQLVGSHHADRLVLEGGAALEAARGPWRAPKGPEAPA